MRTPLACRLRVMISPWKSFPTFLNEPMVAMSLLLLCFEPATTAASMAMGRPRTIGDAPAGPERSGGRCRRDFLASRGMGVSPGEESRVDSVASQTIEAQPVFGQIKPSQRPGASRAEPQSREKRWLISVMHKRLERFGEEKETQCGKWRNRRRERSTRATSLHVYAERD